MCVEVACDVWRCVEMLRDAGRWAGGDRRRPRELFSHNFSSSRPFLFLAFCLALASRISRLSYFSSSRQHLMCALFLGALTALFLMPLPVNLLLSFLLLHLPRLRLHTSHHTCLVRNHHVDKITGDHFVCLLLPRHLFVFYRFADDHRLRSTTSLITFAPINENNSANRETAFAAHKQTTFALGGRRCSRYWLATYSSCSARFVLARTLIEIYFHFIT